jgi:hypothetical protein
VTITENASLTETMLKLKREKNAIILAYDSDVNKLISKSKWENRVFNNDLCR